ncbi:hypothetical protein GCM10018966_059010 [Streptomyces yanii]
MRPDRPHPVWIAPYARCRKARGKLSMWMRPRIVRLPWDNRYVTTVPYVALVSALLTMSG